MDVEASDTPGERSSFSLGGDKTGETATENTNNVEESSVVQEQSYDTNYTNAKSTLQESAGVKTVVATKVVEEPQEKSESDKMKKEDLMEEWGINFDFDRILNFSFGNLQSLLLTIMQRMKKQDRTMALMNKMIETKVSAAEMHSEFRERDQKIGSLDLRVTALEDRMDEVDLHHDEVNEKFNKLDQRIDTLKDDLEKRLDGHDTEIEQLKKDVKDHKDLVIQRMGEQEDRILQDMEERLQKKASTDWQDEIEEWKQAVDDAIGMLHTNLQQVSDNVETNKGDLDDQIDNIQRSLAGKADDPEAASSNVDELQLPKEDERPKSVSRKSASPLPPLPSAISPSKTPPERSASASRGDSKANNNGGEGIMDSELRERLEQLESAMFTLQGRVDEEMAPTIDEHSNALMEVFERLAQLESNILNMDGTFNDNGMHSDLLQNRIQDLYEVVRSLSGQVADITNNERIPVVNLCTPPTNDAKGLNDGEDENAHVMTDDATQAEADEKTQTVQDEGTQAETDEKTQTVQDEGTQAETDEKTQTVQDEGTQAEADEKTQTVQDESTQAEADEKTQTVQDDGAQAVVPSQDDSTQAGGGGGGETKTLAEGVDSPALTLTEPTPANARKKLHQADDDMDPVAKKSMSLIALRTDGRARTAGDPSSPRRNIPQTPLTKPGTASQGHPDDHELLLRSLETIEHLEGVVVELYDQLNDLKGQVPTTAESRKAMTPEEVEMREQVEALRRSVSPSYTLPQMQMGTQQVEAAPPSRGRSPKEPRPPPKPKSPAEKIPSPRRSPTESADGNKLLRGLSNPRMSPNEQSDSRGQSRERGGRFFLRQVTPQAQQPPSFSIPESEWKKMQQEYKQMQQQVKDLAKETKSTQGKLQEKASRHDYQRMMDQMRKMSFDRQSSVDKNALMDVKDMLVDELRESVGGGAFGGSSSSFQPPPAPIVNQSNGEEVAQLLEQINMINNILDEKVDNRDLQKQLGKITNTLEKRFDHVDVEIFNTKKEAGKVANLASGKVDIQHIRDLHQQVASKADRGDILKIMNILKGYDNLGKSAEDALAVRQHCLSCNTRIQEMRRRATQAPFHEKFLPGNVRQRPATTVELRLRTADSSESRPSVSNFTKTVSRGGRVWKLGDRAPLAPIMRAQVQPHESYDSDPGTPRAAWDGAQLSRALQNVPGMSPRVQYSSFQLRARDSFSDSSRSGPRSPRVQTAGSGSSRWKP